MDDASNIENRPEELRDIPFYNSLPDMPLHLDLEGVTGDFFTHDIFQLEGVQPHEEKHSQINGGVLRVNPSEQSLELYRKERVEFQIVHLIVNAYDFEERDGILCGKPYCISLKPSTKREVISHANADWVGAMNWEKVGETEKKYIGFNPFQNTYGFFVIGPSPMSKNVEADMIGFVYRTYALATSFDHRRLLTPQIPIIQDNNQVRRDYAKYRKDRYFKIFSKDKPRKIWGCDSPIELFLLQAMSSIGLKPVLQVIICGDGEILPNFHKLWENQKSRRRIKTITEADFYFHEQKLAVFCDSKTHHSSVEAIKKDNAIDEKLKNIGIRSLRIYGPDIVKSPMACADKVKDALAK